MQQFSILAVWQSCGGWCVLSRYQTCRHV